MSPVMYRIFSAVSKSDAEIKRALHGRDLHWIVLRAEVGGGCFPCRGPRQKP